MERQMIYPLIALRGITVFPGIIIHFDLNRKKSIAAVNAAMQNNQEVVVCCQRQTEIDDPGKEDLYELYKAAPYATIIASHMEAFNHWSLSRAELREFSVKKGFDSSLLVPEDGESYSLT